MNLDHINLTLNILILISLAHFIYKDVKSIKNLIDISKLKDNKKGKKL